MPKQIRFYRKKKYFVLLTLALIAGGFIYYSLTREVKPVYSYVTAEKADLVQVVSVTGKVEAAESVDLAFEVGGKVDQIYVDVGDKVETGDKLVSLTYSDLQAQLQQAQASVVSAQATLQQYQAAVKNEQAKLDELKKGSRKEEIDIAETTVLNAKKDITDAETTLTNTKAQAEADMTKVYQEASNALPTAVNAGKAALLTLTDIQYKYFSGYDTDETKIANAKATAVYELLGTNNAGRYSTQPLSILKGGIYGEVQMMLDPTDDETDEALTDVKSALQKVKLALDSVPVSSDLTSTDKTSLDTEKTNINTAITALSNKQQAISVQAATNQSSISAAESGINTAKSTLATAQNTLTLKKAGYTKEQIDAQEAQVDQAKANLNAQKASVSQAYSNVQYYQAQIEKTILTAPIPGIITSMEAKPGEIVMPSSSTLEVQKPLLSIMGEGVFEIKTDIPEADIAKVKVGDMADVTLDAYGSDVIFEAVVLMIDPAETVVEGVSTYETTLQFMEADTRIKSGMTANLDILTAEKDDVIAIPQRAVITKDDTKIVRILKTIADPKNPDKTIEELESVEVETGLRGSSGEIEILSGVQEGDKVVIYVEENGA